MVLKFFLFFILFSLGVRADLMPMQTVINTKTQELVGLVIPIYEQQQNRISNDGTHRTVFSTVGMNPAVNAAMAQLRSLGLQPFFLNGKVIGTLEGYKAIQIVNSTTIGFSAQAKMGSERALILGTDVMYGLKVDWSIAKDQDLRSEHGLWLSDPLTNIMRVATVLGERKSAIELTEDVLRVAALTAARNQSASSSDWPQAQFNNLRSTALADTEVISAFAGQNNLTAPIQKKVFAFNIPANLSQEQSWKNFEMKVNDHAPVWADRKAQTYLQNLCDRLSPLKNFSFRCRIFASLTPYAFSYPGGDIFITAGLFHVLKNESTLAFFLAHEMSHALSRHFTENLQKKDFQMSLFNTLSLVSSVLSFKTPQIELIKKVGAFATDVSFEKIYAGLSSHYTAENEFEADSLGLQLSTGLGYDKQLILDGLNSLTQSLQDDFPGEIRAKNAEARFKSWPDRLKTLKSEKDAIKNFDVHSTDETQYTNFKKQFEQAYLYYTSGLWAEAK